MFCDKCGSQIREGAKFCSECGNQIGGNTGATTNQSYNNSPSHSNKKTTKIKFTDWLIILLGVTIGVAILIATGIMSINNQSSVISGEDYSGSYNSTDSTSSNTNNSTTTTTTTNSKTNTTTSRSVDSCVRTAVEHLKTDGISYDPIKQLNVYTGNQIIYYGDDILVQISYETASLTGGSTSNYYKSTFSINRGEFINTIELENMTVTPEWRSAKVVEIESSIMKKMNEQYF